MRQNQKTRGNVNRLDDNWLVKSQKMRNQTSSRSPSDGLRNVRSWIKYKTCSYKKKTKKKTKKKESQCGCLYFLLESEMGQ